MTPAFVGIAPWVSRPHVLVSLKQMHEFFAYEFCNVLQKLRDVELKAAASGQREMTAEEWQATREVWSQLQTHCESIQVNDPIQTMAEIFGRREPPANSELSVELRMLRAQIDQGLAKQLFMFISYDDSWFFNNALYFEPGVSTSFPSVKPEVLEAVNCYATDRSYGCVFHCMRILEIGLTSLAREVGLAPSQYNYREWYKILEPIEKTVEKVTDRAKRDFYSQAAKQFRYFKDAWRNHTMHVHGITYGKAESKIIMDSVRDFMQALAKGGLHE